MNIQEYPFIFWNPQTKSSEILCKKSLVIRQKIVTIMVTFYIVHQIMRIIARKTLSDFWEKHPDCEQQLKSRYSEITRQTFPSSQLLLTYYPRASSLPWDRIVFRIKGNDYRIIVKINYAYQILRIRFVGTHQEYDHINAQNI